MAKRKQKIVLEGFTFTVGKLIIEQEAEDFEVDGLPDGVRQAIGDVITAPGRLLTVEPASTVPSTATPAQPAAGPKRRRRSQRTTVAADGANGDASPRSSKGGGTKALVLELKEHGFFAQDRSIGEIREELHTRGHSFKSNEISPVLLSLTQQKVLARRKDDNQKWVYRDGAK